MARERPGGETEKKLIDSRLDVVISVIEIPLCSEHSSPANRAVEQRQ